MPVCVCMCVCVRVRGGGGMVRIGYVLGIGRGYKKYGLKKVYIRYIGEVLIINELGFEKLNVGFSLTERGVQFLPFFLLFFC